jgi:glutathione synthase
LNHFDAIIMRKDPPFDLSYVTATWFLSQACLEGAKVFNAPDALMTDMPLSIIGQEYL